MECSPTPAAIPPRSIAKSCVLGPAASVEFFASERLGCESLFLANLPNLIGGVKREQDDEAPQDQVGPARVGPDGDDSHDNDGHIHQHIVSG